jgi:AcrR family transcriptional regulator
MPEREDVRTKIVAAAARLLERHGRAGVSTRSVSAAAGVQAPTIYRAFGDMQGLLEAVALFGFAGYLKRKTSRRPAEDPVDDLRAGWDLHVGYGVEHPEFYRLIYGQEAPGHTSEAAATAYQVLISMVRRIAAAGRLTVPVETAATMVYSASLGVTFALLGKPTDERDDGLSERMRELVISAITGEANEPNNTGANRRAIALAASLDSLDGLLSPGERAFLDELLDRIASSSPGAA